METLELKPSNPKIEEIKARVAKFGGAPCGTIPTEKLKALTNRIAPSHMDTLCLDRCKGYFTERYYATRVKIMGESIDIRISLDKGGFFLEDCGKPIPGSCPLTLWLITGGYPLEWGDGKTALVCRSKRHLHKAFRELTKWVENRERIENQKPKRDINEVFAEMEALVFLAVLEGQNRKTYQATGIKIWRLVEAYCGEAWGEVIREYPMLRSNADFRGLLDCWIGISDKFTVEKFPYDKVVLYRLTLKS